MPYYTRLQADTSFQTPRLSLVNVLIVGSGGAREHAILEKLFDDDRVEKVFLCRGNYGLSNDKRVVNVEKCSDEDMMELCRCNNVGLAIIDGRYAFQRLSSILRQVGIPVFGPSQEAMEIETSKAWSKDFMVRHGIPTAVHMTFHDAESAIAFVEERSHWPGFVVKASGLAAGCGVVVCNSIDDARMSIHSIFEEFGAPVVVEECIDGREVSAFAVTDGSSFMMLPPARDYKRAFDGDTGPNTGGMGCYVSEDLLSSEELSFVKDEIVAKTVAGMAAEGRPFVGCLYVGLMLTSSGIKVLEYNARFGDPEAQALIPVLDCNLFDLLYSCASGTLNIWSRGSSYVGTLSEKPCSVCVLVVSKGYPYHYEKGFVISGVQEACSAPEVDVYLAWCRLDTDRRTLLTDGARVLSVVASGSSVSEARESAYKAVEAIHFRQCTFRKGIAEEVDSDESASTASSRC